MWEEYSWQIALTIAIILAQRRADHMALLRERIVGVNLPKWLSRRLHDRNLST